MQIIEAALAFAITMLFLSMIVTTIVELLHRALGIREKGLSIMLEKVFDEVLWPRIRSSLDGASADTARQAFARELGRNRIGSGQKKTFLTSFLRRDRLDALSTMQFVQRLADSDAGKTLFRDVQKQGKSAVDMTARDIARRFEEIGADASEFFSARTRLVSVAISLLLVFAINVDALHLFKSYLENDELRSGVIEQSAQLQEDFKRQSAEFDRMMEDLADGELSQEHNLEALKASTGRLSTQIETIDSSGMPIGWQYFPYCDGMSAMGICRATEPPGTGTYVVWFLGVILAGVLVGLGGPFWFDAIRGLTLALSIAKTGSDGQKARDREAARGTATGIKPADVSDAFVTAASLSVGIHRRRAILQRNGLKNGPGGRVS